MSTWNRDSHWAKGLINLNQSSAERQAKYRLARKLGGSQNDARQMRDWRWTKIQRAFGQKEVLPRNKIWDVKEDKLKQGG